MEHIVLLDEMDVLELLDPTLPLDAELRLELDPCGFGDLVVRRGITIERFALASWSVGGAGTTGRITGGSPVS